MVEEVIGGSAYHKKVEKCSIKDQQIDYKDIIVEDSKSIEK